MHLCTVHMCTDTFTNVWNIDYLGAIFVLFVSVTSTSEVFVIPAAIFLPIPYSSTVAVYEFSVRPIVSVQIGNQSVDC